MLGQTYLGLLPTAVVSILHFLKLHGAMPLCLPCMVRCAASFLTIYASENACNRIAHAVVQTERSVRKENNDKVKELEHALAEARTELQAEKLLLQQVSNHIN